MAQIDYGDVGPNPWDAPIRGWYQQYLGRAPESDQAVTSWSTQGAGAEAGIRDSAEGKAYAALQKLGTGGGASTAPAGGGGSIYDQIRAYQGSHPVDIAGISSALNLPRFMYGSTPSNNELDVNGQKFKVLSEGSGQWYLGGDDSGGGGGGAPAGWSGSTATPYSDSSAMLYLNQALARLEALRQPVQDPFLDTLKQLSLSRVQNLRADKPYTAGEDAALTAQYREPLTQARDAAYARNKEEASRKGYLPSSGLLRRLDTDVSRGYEQGIAQGATQLGVRAVDEKQRREDEALQILAGLVSADATSRRENEGRQQEALQVAGLFPQFDETRLNSLLRASGGDSPSSLIGGLTQLASLNQNASLVANRQGSEDAYAWAQLLYDIIHRARTS